MTLYRSIIKQAFLTAWEHKYLWFFGLFATLLTSNFELELVQRFINRSFTLYDLERWQETGIFSGQFWLNLGEIARTQPWSFASIILVLLILLALIAALVWLSVVSQVALVSNTNKALANGKKLTVAERRHDTSVGFVEGKRNFWPILGLNIGIRVVVYALALISLVPIINWGGRGLGANIAYLIVFIVFLAIALAISLMARYAIAAVVLKRETFAEAVTSSWNLFWANWLASLEMAFILFAVSVLSTFAIIIAVLVMAIPSALLFILTFIIGSAALYYLVLAVALLVSISIVIIGGSIVTVIQISAWVNFYNQLVGKSPVVSKLQRVFND